MDLEGCCVKDKKIVDVLEERVKSVATLQV